jgi:hypothetical protein
LDTPTSAAKAGTQSAKKNRHKGDSLHDDAPSPPPASAVRDVSAATHLMVMSRPDPAGSNADFSKAAELDSIHAERLMTDSGNYIER